MSTRYLITQSLLSAWRWGLTLEDGYADFLKTLRREPIQQTKEMLEGIRFENCLCSVLNGEAIEPKHEWFRPIMELVPELAGAQQQVRISKKVTIRNVDFVLYGVLDFLRSGVITDTKYSKTYHVGKYFDSPQHPMYLSLVPEAYKFQYKICDGKYIYTETYYPGDTEPIEHTIEHFIDFLHNMGLVKIYCDNWRSLYD